MEDLKIVTYNNKLKPILGTEDASCYDLFASEEIVIEPGEIILLGLGIKTNFACDLYVRSSLPLKKGIILPNGVGIIDKGYRGELKAQLMNITKSPIVVFKNERIMQLRIDCEYRVKGYNLDIIVNQEKYDKWEEIYPTKRSTGGFGSSGGYIKK